MGTKKQAEAVREAIEEMHETIEECGKDATIREIGEAFAAKIKAQRDDV